jgi:hypothetical protein
MSAGKVISGLRILERFPSREVTAIVLEHADKVDYLPKRDTMKKLVAMGEKHRVIRDTIAPHVKPPAVELCVTRSVKPRRMTDLSPTWKKQLVVAGEHYDGKTLPAAVRLGVAPYTGRGAADFQSFAGFLEIRELAIAGTKKPAYTAFLYLVDSGTIFAAGTTRVVGVFIQCSLLGPDGRAMKDRDLHEALQPVLRF